MTKTTRLGAAAFGLLTVAFPLHAYAQYQAPIPFRLLTDPAYLPLQGQLYGSSAFTITDSTADLYDAAGAKSGTRKGWDDTITQELEYGITNDLALRLDDSYTPFDKH